MFLFRQKRRRNPILVRRVVGGRVGGISGGSRRKGGSTSKIKSIEKFKTKYAN